jgi:hypothetical protein
MRQTKYFLHYLFEINSGEREAVNVMLPMNRPLMLVRIAGQLRVKKLSGGDRHHRWVEPAHPDQVSLL